MLQGLHPGEIREQRQGTQGGLTRLFIFLFLPVDSSAFLFQQNCGVSTVDNFYPLHGGLLFFLLLFSLPLPLLENIALPGKVRLQKSVRFNPAGK